jgi:cyclase
MKRERVSDDIVVFTSTLYAQVNAGAVLTPAGAVLIDTLPFPEETREIADYLKSEGARGVVRYVIDTHRHGDHTHGNYLFPQAEIIGHRLCRDTLLKWGNDSLQAAKEATPELDEVVLRIPNITFEREMSLYIGGMTLEMLYLPGHTIDGIGVLIRSERVLFSGDAIMPLPSFVWGDRDQLIQSMQRVKGMDLEHIVQGHGDVLLRGEMAEVIDENLAYLDNIYQKVKKRVELGASERDLEKITVEKSGGSPIAMDGMGKKLHQANLIKLYRSFKEEQQRAALHPVGAHAVKKPRARRRGSDADAHPAAAGPSARKRVAKKRETSASRS